MNNLVIDKSDCTPFVEFNENGQMKLEGRSFSEDPKKFFDPLINWCQQLHAKEMNLEVKLDYLNTSSTKFVNEIIRTIDANTNIENKEIKWYFEEDDDDMLEVGQIIEENTLSTKFYFHEVLEF